MNAEAMIRKFAKCSLLEMLGCFLLMIPSTAHGQRYGLLLGFAPRSAYDVAGQVGASDPPLRSGPMAGYATVWLTIEGSDVHGSILRDIVIPRRDGFWRLGGDLAVASTEHESEMEVFLWAEPISTQHQPGKPAEPSCPEFNYVQTPTWINPDYVGVSVFQSATCAHYDESHDAYVLKLHDLTVARSADNLPRPLALAGTLGPAAVQQAARRASRPKNKDEDDAWPCGNWIVLDAAWQVVHRQGSWLGLAQLGQEGPGICDRLSTEVTITSPVLDRLARRKPLPISFASVQKQVPSARDVVFSPDGRVAVVVGIDGLEVRRLQSRHLSERLASIDLQPYHIEPDVVMAESALGTHVADWDRQMRSLPKLERAKEDEP